MTAAQQMISNLEAERAKAPDGSLNQRWPPGFYRQDITVAAPDGQTTMCSPKYCLTDAACQQLIAALATRGLVCTMLPGGGPPNATGFKLGGGWKYSDQANWMYLAFDSGNVIIMPFNPGIVFDYFAHGYPAHYALNTAQWELLQDAFAGGFTQAAPNVTAIMAQTAD